MNDLSKTLSRPTRDSSWAHSTGQWMADKLQLAPPDSGSLTNSLRPEEVRRLKSVAKHGTTDFYFPKRLEDQFKREQREGSKAERLCAVFITMTLFALGPLWAHWMLSLPEGTKTLELWLYLGVVTPVFAIVAFLQYRYVASEFAEISLIIAFTIEVIVIEFLRIQAAELGVRLLPVITAAVPITAFILLGLTTKRRTYLFAGYFFVLWIADLYLACADTQRDASVWMTEVIFLTLAWIAALFNRISARRAWAANILLNNSANQDSLTGLANRSAFEVRYDQQMRLGFRYGKSSVLALIDLDHFKLVNDYYGHPYGDGVLVEVGLLLNDWARRPGDFAARIGGEEFALFLYDCPAEAATVRLNGFLKAVQDLQLEHVKSQMGVVTASAGAVVVQPNTALSAAYHDADSNLYRAKNEG